MNNSPLQPNDRGRLLVDIFINSFKDESYRLLAEHAALPDVLTPELISYIHSRFLAYDVVNYEAGADLLLSELCRMSGQEQYTMDADAREYLLAAMDERPGGAERKKEVARLLLGYLTYLARKKGSVHDRSMENQRLGAMIYIDEERKEAVAALVNRINQCVSAPAELTVGAAPGGNHAEIARICRRIEEFAELLKKTGYERLIELARVIKTILYDETGEAISDLRQSGQLDQKFEMPGIEIDSTLLQRLAEITQSPAKTELPAKPATGAEIDSNAPAQNAEPETKLVPFEFETITLNPSGKVVKREKKNARQFIEELLADVRLEMVEIPGGKFMMGAPKEEKESYDDERPQHEVTVSPFYTGKFTITQKQWRVVAGWEKVERDLDPNPSHFKDRKDSDERPVEQVSWEDAVEFCARLAKKTGRAYRLPSEAEWEFACRAGTTTPFAFGETIISKYVNYDEKYPYGKVKKGKGRGETVAVGSLGVANPFGLFDMHGNVWEWCQDWYGNYPSEPQTDPTGPEKETSSVLRGGSWNSNGLYCRSAYRDYYQPGYRHCYLGFRVVVSVARTL